MATRDDFRKALSFTLQWEGGFVNHPADPGGATNRGVTQRVYDGYRQRKGLARQSVRSITTAEVEDIYLNGYWGPSHPEDMKPALAAVQFDTAVNFGVAGAIKFLQRALGVGADGQYGSQTRTALLAKDQNQLVLRYCDLRVARRHARVAERPDQRVFLKGWLNRDNALRVFAKGLMAGTRGVLDAGAEGFQDIWDIQPAAPQPEFGEAARDATAEPPEEITVAVRLTGVAVARYLHVRDTLSAAYNLTPDQVDEHLLRSGAERQMERLRELWTDALPEESVDDEASTRQ